MLSLFWMVDANAQAVLRFQEHINAHAHVLGDIVSISQSHQQLMQLALDSTPKAGEQITKEQIIQWISNKSEAFDYQWRGKQRARIEQNINSTGQELYNKAQAALEQHLKRHYDSIKLTVKGTIKDSEYPLSELQVEIPASLPPAKQICVRLRHGKHSIPVWFSVNAYKSVLVAAHPIKNRTTIQRTDFMLKKRNIAGLSEQPLTQLPETAWLTKTINKGHILTARDVINTPQILRGHTIEVKVKTRGISILSNAIAQNDGYTGQVIRLKNPSSNKYFAAKITAPGKAEISS